MAQTLPPPKLKIFPVDHALAQAGEPIYRQRCARCHAMDGERTGQVIALTDEAEQGVDPARRARATPITARCWTPAAAGLQQLRVKISLGLPALPLDRWLRERAARPVDCAPYLHNGSVPFLAELFETPDKRTKVFHRGLDVYDPQRMGFVSEGPEAERAGTIYDTSTAGNSNQGHLWGIELKPEEKRALIEYLKTL